MKSTLHGFTIQEGERVWSVTNGWGAVVRIDDKDRYTLGVIFDDQYDNSSVKWFTSEGFYDVEDHTKPSLFWEEFQIPDEAFKKPTEIVRLDMTRDGNQWFQVEVEVTEMHNKLLGFVKDGYTVREAK